MMKLVKYGAKWCSPCKAMDRFTPRVAQEAGLEYESVDIEESPEGVPASITSVPVLSLVDDSGVEVRTHTGAMNPTALKRWILG